MFQVGKRAWVPQEIGLVVLCGADGVTGFLRSGPSCLLKLTIRIVRMFPTKWISSKCYVLCKSILLCVIRRLVLFTLNHRLAIDLG